VCTVGEVTARVLISRIRMRALWLCVIFGVSLLLLACSATTTDEDSVQLRWCDDAPPPGFNGATRVRWIAHGRTSRLEYSICSQQSRTLSSICQARFTVGEMSELFHLCANRMDCVRQSMQRQTDGLYCIRGQAMLGLPLSHANGIPVHLRIMDTTQSKFAMFCPV
jgi:hypothetical protein